MFFHFSDVFFLLEIQINSIKLRKYYMSGKKTDYWGTLESFLYVIVFNIVLLFLLLFCLHTAMMKQQAPWILATHDPLRTTSQGWMTKSMLLPITMVLWSLKYHIFSVFSVVWVYKSRTIFPAPPPDCFPNCYLALFSFRILVFLPRTNAVRVQLQLEEGHSHHEDQLHAQLLRRESATVGNGFTTYTEYAQTCM